MKTSSQMFLGAVAAAMTTSSAFVQPIGGTMLARQRLAAPSAVTMTSGSDYVATLPGTPFPDGAVWDPLGFSTKNDPETIKKFREAELKHGRVAMLAAVGILVAESFHPLFLGPDYIGPAVDHFQEITARFPAFWVAATTGIAFIEYQAITQGWGEVDSTTGTGNLKPEYTPGDLGFDPLGLNPEDPEALKTMQTKELNNGRLAMIGVAGMLVQELVDSQSILDHIA
ncbi:unnamed protein product [Discosporangium mesarthrocarpum]